MPHPFDCDALALDRLIRRDAIMNNGSISSDDERALGEIVCRYARCADQKDGAGYAALFEEDGVLEVGETRYAGASALAKIPPMLGRFFKTYHTVFNSLFTIDGDAATGEIYSAAHHLTPAEGDQYSDYVMYITYRDRYRRSADGWRIATRTVNIEMTETRAVTVPPPAFA
jgi:hypothetical protein